MDVHPYAPAYDLERLRADAANAMEGWAWRRGAYGHALSLPAPEQLHGRCRYSYQNHPCTGQLDLCSYFQEIFDSFQCPKLSFRLLRRAPHSAYAWHADAWKGPGVVRFQIPIETNERALLVLSDYAQVEQLRPHGAQTSVAEAEAANDGHVRAHCLEPGVLYYFNTSHVHTLVNDGDCERITLSFDLLANDWLVANYPEVCEEAVVTDPAEPGAARLLLARAGSLLHPLRNRLRPGNG
ncbi:MAG: hypothetical protein E4H18_05190 [Hyphomicrobiales bacterium]|nr:MAG: hypothetical protein E4H18_05190 [Hyphomicrobiales bacterium]